jgi:hypothetical protein
MKASKAVNGYPDIRDQARPVLEAMDRLGQGVNQRRIREVSGEHPEDRRRLIHRPAGWRVGCIPEAAGRLQDPFPCRIRDRDARMVVEHPADPLHGHAHPGGDVLERVTHRSSRRLGEPSPTPVPTSM